MHSSMGLSTLLAGMATNQSGGSSLLRRMSLKSTGGFGHRLHQSGVALTAEYPHGNETAIEEQGITCNELSTQKLQSSAETISDSILPPSPKMTEASLSGPSAQRASGIERSLSQGCSELLFPPFVSLCCLSVTAIVTQDSTSLLSVVPRFLWSHMVFTQGAHLALSFVSMMTTMAAVDHTGCYCSLPGCSYACPQR
jgi:hypothetical protein